MKIFKLDLMTLLVLVVALGVAATMSTQVGGSRSMENVASVSAQPLNTAQVARP